MPRVVGYGVASGCKRLHCIAAMNVFDCADVRRVIFSFVYPARVRVGMSFVAGDTHGRITAVARMAEGWRVELFRSGVDLDGFPYSVTSHLYGDVRGKVCSE